MGRNHEGFLPGMRQFFEGENMGILPARGIFTILLRFSVKYALYLGRWGFRCEDFVSVVVGFTKLKK